MTEEVVIRKVQGLANRRLEIYRELADLDAIEEVRRVVLVAELRDAERMMDSHYARLRFIRSGGWERPKAVEVQVRPLATLAKPASTVRRGILSRLRAR